MRTKVVVLVGVLIAVGVAIASGQAQRSPATLDEVVNEIRGIRADLKMSTAATTQVQLLTVRLQLQEQRLAVLSNQRNDVMARLAIETQLRADKQAQVQRFEEMKTRNEDLGIPRAEIEGAAAASRRELTLHRDAEQQLRAQETQLSTEIAGEQNRWQDFNN